MVLHCRPTHNQANRKSDREIEIERESGGTTRKSILPLAEVKLMTHHKA